MDTEPKFPGVIDKEAWRNQNVWYLYPLGLFKYAIEDIFKALELIHLMLPECGANENLGKIIENFKKHQNG